MEGDWGRGQNGDEQEKWRDGGRNGCIRSVCHGKEVGRQGLSFVFGLLLAMEAVQDRKTLEFPSSSNTMFNPTVLICREVRGGPGRMEKAMAISLKKQETADSGTWNKTQNARTQCFKKHLARQK